MRKSAGMAMAVALVAVGATFGSSGIATAAGGGPRIIKGGGQETFKDDFILDLCGIATKTTATERWTLKLFPSGAETLHVVRTFVSEDTRIPIEKGAATNFTAPDGTRRVVGKPLHLIDQVGGGVRVIDAGWVEFDPDGNLSDVRGPHPSLDGDLADFYCP